jgi:hypothetical protein
MFIALAIIAGLGLILYKLLRFVQTKDQNQRAGLASLAQKRGWRYEDAPGKLIDFRLSGTTNGVSWQVVGKRDPGNENTTPSTVWSTNNIHYDDLVGLIRTRKGFEVMESTWVRVASGVLSAMISVVGLEQPQHAEVVKTGIRLKPKSPAIEAEFVAIVRPNRGLDGLLTPALEQALQAWHDAKLLAAEKDSLSIDIGQTNLRVYCKWILAAEHMERFITLGLATAAAVKGEERPAGPLL